MTAITEERALLVECYSRMQEIAGIFNQMAGTSVERRDANSMSDAEMLTEMRSALAAVQERIGPAIQSPMIQMLLKRMG